MDSLRAAGWKFPGRPEACDEQRGDREPQTSDPSTDQTGDEQQTLADQAKGDGSTAGPAGEAAAGKLGRLEGCRDYVVDDPAEPGRTITDIDRVQNGVLWEEKSATDAGDIGRWVAKHIDKKFSSYLDARQYIVGYEEAPIGFSFTSPDVDPAFRSEVESAVERLRLKYPDEQILLEWSE
ncbi:Uncharacterised protein [Mycobacterium tuberculosis]|nr:Uncharacterised protein [Mycobacterium tuberculosis]